MRKKTLTLAELLLAISLLGVIILGAISFDTTARRFLLSTERRTRVLNEAAYILDHIHKNALLGIGDSTVTYQSDATAAPLTLSQPFRHCASGTCTNAMLLIKQDTDGDGRRDADTVDHIVGYAVDGNGQLYFCDDVVNKSYCSSGSRTVLSNNALAFSWTLGPDANNIQEIKVGVCYDRTPTNDTPRENPHVTMLTRAATHMASTAYRAGVN